MRHSGHTRVRVLIFLMGEGRGERRRQGIARERRKEEGSVAISKLLCATLRVRARAQNTLIFREPTFITSCPMTSSAETFVLSSRDTRRGANLLFVFGLASARVTDLASPLPLQPVSPVSPGTQGIPVPVVSDREDSGGARPGSAVHFRRLNSAAAPTDKRP